MIEAIEVIRRFEPRRAAPVLVLDRVSVACRAGEVTALLGPNGAGKTTLFRVLAGLLRCHGGRARILGHDVAAAREEAARRTGLLTEEPALPERLTPRWHVRFHVALREPGWAEAGPKADRLLARLGLSAEADRPCGVLSRGTRRKVALARALAGEPPALLLDEPTASLDIESSLSIRAEIASLAREGRAVLMATHDAHEAESLADRVVVLRGGRVLADGPPGELMARTGRSSLQEAYLALQKGRR
ncbi:MAG TPA: ABC transporter ATP-binding protein [Candidatus Polarisedimenticolia bacterium]|nr:ABC transporter ATP-binding protein [Candidatus Polarisedimenticolia bacterium]